MVIDIRPTVMALRGVSLKYIIECISEPMTHICNLSLKFGVFPHKTKTAKVIPLYKSGEKSFIYQLQIDFASTTVL